MPASSIPETGVRDVKSAARTVELLEVLSSRRNRPTSIRELSEEMGVPRSSLHALLRTLAKHGWVRGDSSGSMYMIGIRALLAGTSYLDSDPYLPVVQTFLDDLHEQHDETFHFGRLDGTDVVYLATRESSQYLRAYSRVGRRLPAFTTSLGKALLADRAGADLDRHLPRSPVALTPHTLVRRDALDADLAATRARGYAIDAEENTVGLRCFAVALPYAEPAMDAISVSFPLSRLTDDREREIIAALQLASRKIVNIVRPIKDAAWT
jgi:DNA-binding IclR family transcriptional regulator